MTRPGCFAALLLCACLPAQAEPIGRLFTTPEERTMLERVRISGEAAAASEPAADASASAGSAKTEAAAPRQQLMVINGVVRRSGSEQETVWINAVPHRGTLRQRGAGQPYGQGAGRVSVTLPSGKNITVKAGQSVDAASGKVRESYQARPLD